MLKKLALGALAVVSLFAAVCAVSPAARAALPSILSVIGPTPAGTVSTSSPVQAGGVDSGGHVRKLLVDTTGALIPSTTVTPAVTSTGTAVPVAAAVGGAGMFFNDAVAATKVQIKATQGQLYSLHLVNGSAATSYLQVFCLPSAGVTVGSTAPSFDINLPTNAASNFTSDLTFPVGAGCATGTGITIAATTTATGSSAASVSVTASYL